MMKVNLNIGFLLCSIWFSIILGCSPGLYNSNQVFTPIVEQKGEVQSIAGFDNLGIGASVAVAVTDRIPVFASYRFEQHRRNPLLTSTYDSPNRHRNVLYEFGTGFVFPFSNWEKNIGLAFFGSAAYGNGTRFKTTYITSSYQNYYDFSGNFIRFSATPTAYWKGRKVSLTLGTRFSYIEGFGLSGTKYVDSQVNQQNAVRTPLRLNTNGTSIEPIVGIMVGRKKLGLQFTIGASISELIDKYYLAACPVRFGAGIFFQSDRSADGTFYE